MANNGNLKPFKKGTSGNPNGRPKGVKNRSTIARKWLEAKIESKNPITGEMEWMTMEDQITLAQMMKARKSDTPAYNALLNSAYGNPKDSLDISSEGVGFDFDEVMRKIADNGDTES